MLIAAVFAPAFWAGTLFAGLAIVAVRKRIGTLKSTALLVSLALMTWLGSIWFSTQCEPCNSADSSYLTQIRFGLLFWEFAFLALLLAEHILAIRAATRNKKEA